MCVIAFSLVNLSSARSNRLKSTWHPNGAKFDMYLVPVREVKIVLIREQQYVITTRGTQQLTINQQRQNYYFTASFEGIVTKGREK